MGFRLTPCVGNPGSATVQRSIQCKQPSEDKDGTWQWTVHTVADPGFPGRDANPKKGAQTNNSAKFS